MQIDTTPVFKNSDKIFNIELSTPILQQPTPAAVTKKTKTKPVHKKIASSAIKEPEPVEDKSEQLQSSSTTPETPDTNKEQKLSEKLSAIDQQPSQNSHINNEYLQDILKAIEDNKFYPAAARKRNMEDVISISFNLLRSGEIKALEISGKHKQLRYAAKSAILAALPFRQAPKEISFPLTISFSMAFKLTQVKS